MAKLHAHRYESLFVALAVNSENQVVEVHILAREAKQLAYPKTTVEGGDGEDVVSGLVTPDGLPVYYALDLRRAKRR